MTVRHLAPQPCPYCAASLEASTNIDDHAAPIRPRPGDVTLCFVCAGLLVFTGEAMQVRLPADAELLRFQGDSRIAHARNIVHEAIRRRDTP